MSGSTFSALSDYGSLWRYALPYCIRKVSWKGKKHVYIPLNRDYKPLGFKEARGGTHVDYQEHSDQFIVFPRDPSTYRGIWWDGLYLYDDGPESRKTYFERLGKLAVLGKLAIDRQS